MPTAAETASFEAGIKLGALYHQFVGTPVSTESVPSLETAIERSIANQPYCNRVSVNLDEDRIEADANRFGYAEVTGTYLDVEVEIDYDGSTATARMKLEDGYPMMRLVSVENGPDL